MFRHVGVWLCLALVWFGVPGPHKHAYAQGGVRVDLELVLAVDTSGSVDTREYELQIEGLKKAFRDPAVIAAIIGTRPSGGVAVTVVHWSSVNEQRQVVPWTVLKDQQSAYAFSDAISAREERSFGDSTGIGGVLRFSERLIRRNAYEGRRKSIDVSGDGANNSGIPPELVRDMVTNEGITVNGLTILTDEPFLHHYYFEHVIGGAGAFVMTVSDYTDIVVGMRNKLLREISVNIAAGPNPQMLRARP
ncbi:MAG: DUF1194 domain-containing protein [Hyphomicrobiaceae bacterium]|nr:DUF1194 domain-containing protein [Hyphomicrobiaceae bacterium]